MNVLLLLWGFMPMLTLAAQDHLRCTDNKTCHIHDGVLLTDELFNNEKEASLVDNVEVSSTVAETDATEPASSEPTPTTVATQPVTKPTTTTSTKPTPTVPPFVLKAPSSSMCWCDLVVNVCDINCCCDFECSISQKQVFTHCVDKEPVPDPSACYSSDILFRTPSSVKMVEANGYFCVVRENLNTVREFKPRAPLKSVEEFDKEMRRVTRYPMKDKLQFASEPYKSGSTVWAVYRSALEPLRIPAHVMGNLCLSTRVVRFLQATKETCILPSTTTASSQKISNTIQDLLTMKLVTSPLQLNTTDMPTALKNCTSDGSCIVFEIFFCQNYPSKTSCKKISKLATDFNPPGATIHFNIQHNGTEGIQRAVANIWSRKSPELNIEVLFLWGDVEETGFVRSGNPGYLRGRPILAGRKVSMVSNDTTLTKKEAIELSYDPKLWLTIQSAEGTDCSSVRSPALFNVNVRASCFIRQEISVKKDCDVLQNRIIELLLGDNTFNTTSGAINKFVGTFGNSEVENIEDWVQVLIDNGRLFLMSSSFQSSGFGQSCNGIVTDLHIDVAFTKFGSFAKPQSKIVGVLYRFGFPKEIFVRNMTGSLNKNRAKAKVRLETALNFVDVSLRPVREFAQPPGLEAKLPHDFFYPFFSGNAHQVNCNVVEIVLFVAFTFCLYL